MGKIFFAAALVCLVGCQHVSGSKIKFVITPDAPAQTATIACRDSSSGVCHLFFSRNAATIAKIDIRTGSTITVKDISPGTVYCAAVHAPSIDTCKPEPVPSHRATISKESSTATTTGV